MFVYIVYFLIMIFCLFVIQNVDDNDMSWQWQLFDNGNDLTMTIFEKYQVEW